MVYPCLERPGPIDSIGKDIEQIPSVPSASMKPVEKLKGFPECHGTGNQVVVPVTVIVIDVHLKKFSRIVKKNRRLSRVLSRNEAVPQIDAAADIFHPYIFEESQQDSRVSDITVGVRNQENYCDLSKILLKL